MPRESDTLRAGFAATETWELQTDGDTGTLTITPEKIDLVLGSVRASAVLSREGTYLDATVSDGDGERSYRGSRISPVAFPLGASALSIGGQWTLTDVPAGSVGTTGTFTTMNLTAETGRVQLRCQGPDCAEAQIEGAVDAKRTGGASDTFGAAQGEWSPAVTVGEDLTAGPVTTFRLDAAGLRLVVDGETEIDLSWNGSTMSGTAFGEDFAATKR